MSSRQCCWGLALLLLSLFLGGLFSSDDPAVAEAAVLGVQLFVSQLGQGKARDWLQNTGKQALLMLTAFEGHCALDVSAGFSFKPLGGFNLHGLFSLQVL